MVQVKEYDGSITDKQKKALIFMAKKSKMYHKSALYLLITYTFAIFRR